jgi:DEAD/DEAH box helicase domain-containing protein
MGKHALLCDSSCPDCLRSWDNRRLHSLLDWRLALTLFNLIDGGDGIEMNEWSQSIDAAVERFINNYSDIADSVLMSSAICGLPTIQTESKDACLILCNPLWAHSKYLNDFQAEALLEAQDSFARVLLFDIDSLLQNEVAAANFFRARR